MAAETSRFILRALSDIHVGSRYGLCPPTVVFEEGGEYHVSDDQDVMLQWWTLLHNAAFDFPGRQVTVVNGDLVEGKRPVHEVWSPHGKTQADAAVELLAPVVNRSEKAWVVRGTPFHVEDLGNIEDYIAQQVGAVGLRSWPRVRVSLGGVSFEFCHRGPKFGNRLWTWENTLRLHVKSKMMEYLMIGQEPPSVLVYAHYHRLVDTGDVFVETRDGATHRSRGFILPSWKYIDEWTNHTDAPIADIGLVVFEIENGGYKVHKWVEHVDPAKEYEIHDLDTGQRVEGAAAVSNQPADEPPAGERGGADSPDV